VTADQLRQKVLAEYRAASLLEFGDDLEQDGTGNILLAAFVDNAEFNAIEYQPPDVIQCDVAALYGVVESPIWVLLDDANLAHAEVL
jgi:hypothetical protein